MNRTILLSAFAVLAVSAAAVRADDITPEPPFTSSRTRAEVIAEMHAFRLAGINPWADNYDMQAGFVSSRSREQVTNEYLMAREEVAAMHAEDGGSSYSRLPARALAGPQQPIEPVADGPVLAGQPQSGQ